MSKTARTRKFNGKTYKLYKVLMYKGMANDNAKNLREAGRLARVVKAKDDYGTKGYAVYATGW